MRPQPGFAPYIATLGTGARPALGLHCTMAFGGAWAGVSKCLPDLTLTVPDMPSHGRSADWDETSDFADTVFTSSLAAMGDAPMDVIGHSFGAVTALRLAAQHPERIRSLTMIEPVFFVIAQADRPETLTSHDENAKPFLDAIASGDRENAARAFNKMWSTDAPRWHDIPERNRAAMTRAIHVVPDTHSFLYDDAAGILAPAELSDCHVPTLIIRGEHAHPAITATNDGLAKRMPKATQCVIDGAGHMAPISHPQPVAKALRELFATS
ncbi:MAG: alpha/beta hydrolase [Sulfitobacter sp.]